MTVDIFEQNLRTACQDLCDAQIPAPSSHEFSPEHEEQMNALFSRRRRRLPLRIAAIAAAVAIAFAAVWIRPPLANYSFSRDDSGVHVSWIKNSTAIAALRMPTYAPTGYLLRLVFSGKDLYYHGYWTAAKEYLLFYRTPVTAQTETLPADAQEVTVGRWKGFCVEQANAPSRLIWSDGIYVYTVESRLDTATLRVVAASV